MKSKREVSSWQEEKRKFRPENRACRKARKCHRVVELGPKHSGEGATGRKELRVGARRGREASICKEFGVTIQTGEAREWQREG